MKLIPYSEIDGQRNFKDSEIMSLYDRMVSEGTAETVFSDGTIQNREQFLFEMKSDRSQLYLLIEEEPVAVVWLNRFEGKTARFHFCAFSKIWGKKTIEAGQFICSEILNYKIGEKYIFDALLGRIPVSNKIAVDFLKRMGAVLVGDIPYGHWNDKAKKSESCFMVYMDREVLR